MKKARKEKLLDQYNDLAKGTKPDDKWLEHTGIDYLRPLAVRSEESENLRKFVEENKGVVGEKVDLKKKVTENYKNKK